MAKEKCPPVKRPIRLPYTRERTVTRFTQPSMAQQQFKEECDINNIMAKYQKSGLVTHVAKYQGKYDDFTVLPDFKTALDTMNEAQEMFLTIPSEIRREFDNDPGKFVEFATDPDNLDELREMGLAPKPQPQPSGEKPKRAKAAENPPEQVSETPAITPS